ncbi:FLU1-II [Collybia nuda]|uniref:Glutamine synthetase n=1 Tax=Collybia nuda TaxID=64659 RepID=A0A9P5YFI2_9AGAR|nr:FLU1-II [Collybia nuda]
MSNQLSHAIIYPPPTRSPDHVWNILELKKRGVRYVRIQLVDPTNNIRYRIVPISHFERIMQSARPGITFTKAILGSAFLKVAEGFTSDGEYLYVPDMSTVRMMPYKLGHASVLGWFEEKASVDTPDGTWTTKVDFCPRGILRMIIEKARRVSGVEFLVGFETEFVLLSSTSPVTPVHHKHAYSNTLALPTGSIAEVVLEEIVEALQISGIEVQMYHAEASFGQYEIVTGPLPPLQAADALVHTRETIYNISSKHGLRATLAPRINQSSTGSASHAHISVHSTDKSPQTQSAQEPNLTITEASFLAGLLAHLPAVAAITLPLPASFERVADGIWSGGTYVCWGTDNREVPIRLCNATFASSRNFEVKALDGTANPYLALAAILGAGHSGIQTQTQLLVKDCRGPSAAELGEEGRKELGIIQRMPLNWDDARNKLSNDEIMRGILGGDVVDKYLNVNECMGRALNEPDDNDTRLTLLVESY